MVIKNVFTFSCSTVEDISTSSTILSFQVGTVFVKYCSFFRDISSSNPSCFLIYKAVANVMFCSFNLCRAGGGDAHYGNAFFCKENSCCFNNLCASACSDGTSSSTGDSVFVALKSTSFSGKEINASKCISNHGSSSLSLFQSTASYNEISFLNSINGFDHNSLETYGSNGVKVLKSNIVNSTKNTYCTINNGQITLDNCCFISVNSRFVANSDATFIDCIGDSTVNRADVTKYNYQVTLSFQVKAMKRCSKLICTRKGRSSAMSSVLIFVIVNMSY